MGEERSGLIERFRDSHAIIRSTCDVIARLGLSTAVNHVMLTQPMGRFCLKDSISFVPNIFCSKSSKF